jgi:hypothetical protein
MKVVKKKQIEHTSVDFLSSLAKADEAKEIRDYAKENLEDFSSLVAIGTRSFDFRDSPSEIEISIIEVDDFTSVDWSDSVLHAKELILRSCNITALDGLETLANLRKIAAFQSQISNIDALRHFKNLEYLDLSNTGIEDITPLGALQNLVYLDISGNRIQDISSLSNLMQLTHLNASKNEIRVIPEMRTMLLKHLILAENQIAHIQGLDNLVGLELLDMSKNRISQISGLNQLYTLAELNLSYNSILKIEGLGNLAYCQDIILEGNPLPAEILGPGKPDLIKICGGELAPPRKVDRGAPNVVPLMHGILSRNAEDRCLYCGLSVSPRKSETSRCASELEKLLHKAEKLIPSSYKGMREVVGEGTHFVEVGYREWRHEKYFKTKKLDKKIYAHLRGTVFETLAGTVCSGCRSAFITEAEKNLNRFKEMKSSVKELQKKKLNQMIEDRIQSIITATITDHRKLIARWIDKSLISLSERL